jgi:N utilization substance protein A
MTPKKLKKKKPAKPKKALSKKTAILKKALPKKAAPKKKAARKKNAGRGTRRNVTTIALDLEGKRTRSAGQSGSLQGLSDVESADSESVDELLEEGNAYEAEVVEGVENAPDADEGEIKTHEVPEDDVPQEYLDKDE